MSRMRLPSPALVVATIALFVSLGGTALAAAPIVKRALLADNALKLQGKPLAAVVRDAATGAAALPGPASTAAGLVGVKTGAWTLGAGQDSDFTLACDAGQKAVAGGWDDPNGYGHSWDSRPTSDGSGWRTWVTVAKDAPGAQTGTLYVVCLR